MLQYCVGFYQTSTWISHRFTHVPSHLTIPPTSFPFHPSRLLQSPPAWVPWLIFSLSLTRLLPGEEKFIPELRCKVIACFLLKMQRHLFSYWVSNWPWVYRLEHTPFWPPHFILSIVLKGLVGWQHFSGLGQPGSKADWADACPASVGDGLQGPTLVSVLPTQGCTLGLEVFVGPLVCEQSQGHGVHGPPLAPAAEWSLLCGH